MFIPSSAPTAKGDAFVSSRSSAAAPPTGTLPPRPPAAALTREVEFAVEPATRGDDADVSSGSPSIEQPPWFDEVTYDVAGVRQGLAGDSAAARDAIQLGQQLESMKNAGMDYDVSMLVEMVHQAQVERGGGGLVGGWFGGP